MYGLHVHHAVKFFAERSHRPFPTEATVQLVGSDYDKGELLATRVMPFDPKLSAEEIQTELLPIEHDLVSETIANIALGRHGVFTRSVPLIRFDERELYNRAMQFGLANG